MSTIKNLIYLGLTGLLGVFPLFSFIMIIDRLNPHPRGVVYSSAEITIQIVLFLVSALIIISYFFYFAFLKLRSWRQITELLLLAVGIPLFFPSSIALLLDLMNIWYLGWDIYTVAVALPVGIILMITVTILLLKDIKSGVVPFQSNLISEEKISIIYKTFFKLIIYAIVIYVAVCLTASI